MDRFDLHLSFDCIFGDGSDIHRFSNRTLTIIIRMATNANLCLLPVGKSVNILAIPRYTVKTET